MVTFGEYIFATGSEKELVQQFPIDDLVRLEGTILPGFNDAHAHPTMASENLLHLDCGPDVATSEVVLSRMLRGHADGLAAGEWVIGSRYDHTKTTEGRVIDRWFLDSVIPDRPAIVMHVAVHWGVLNSAALEAVGLVDSSESPPGGTLGRDENGRLNGVVYEQALFDVAYPALARDSAALKPSPLTSRLASLNRIQHDFHAAGITSVCDALCGPDDVQLLTTARSRGELSMRVGMLLAYPHYDHLAALGIRGGLGDERLRLVGVKAFIDGACAGGNCLVDEPFAGTDDHGMQVVEEGDLNDLVARAVADGVALGVHANGDRAIKLLLNAHERAKRFEQSQTRHRIEHCTLVDDQIIERIRSLGLVTVPFGSYARFHGDKLPGYYGAARLEHMFAHRDLLDAGVPVAGSSDYPCAPFEPLAGIASCVERRALDGSPVGLSQRITVEEAIGLYTHGSAFASGEEHIKGRLVPGMLADFVELAEDPFLVAPSTIADIPVISTWVGAQCVFDRVQHTRSIP